MTSTEIESEVGTEVEKLLDDAAKRIGQGTIVKFDDIVKLVAPPASPVQVPEIIPLPAEITVKQSDALERLADVYGKIVPLERRMLEPVEATALLVERETLTEIETMAKDRKDAIRTTVLNHNDLSVEADFDEAARIELPRDKEGHYVVAGEVKGEPGTSTKFVGQVSKGSVAMDPQVLKALGDDPEVDWFSHEDYLAMTEQVRRFSEEKAMLLLKKRPELVRAIREATVTGNPSISVYQRKA